MEGENFSGNGTYPFAIEPLKQFMMKEHPMKGSVKVCISLTP